MKNQIGIVKEFNGFTGRIVTDEGIEYILTDNNILKNEKIQVTDEVQFVSENIRGVNLARFVKKRIKK